MWYSDQEHSNTCKKWSFLGSSQIYWIGHFGSGPHGLIQQHLLVITMTPKSVHTWLRTSASVTSRNCYLSLKFYVSFYWQSRNELEDLSWVNSCSWIMTTPLCSPMMRSTKVESRLLYLFQVYLFRYILHPSKMPSPKMYNFLNIPQENWARYLEA